RNHDIWPEAEVMCKAVHKPHAPSHALQFFAMLSDQRSDTGSHLWRRYDVICASERHARTTDFGDGLTLRPIFKVVVKGCVDLLLRLLASCVGHVLVWAAKRWPPPTNQRGQAIGTRRELQAYDAAP